MAKEVAKGVTKELTPLLREIQSSFMAKAEETITKIHEEMKELIEQSKAATKELGEMTTEMANTVGKIMAASYCNALTKGVVSPPVQIDPQVRAKESMRARQFLWNLSGDTQDLKVLSAPQLLKQVNEKLSKAARMTNKECKLHSIVWLKNGGLLLEAGDDKTATWLCSKANILHMECELGLTILPESHNYNVMAYFVPLTFDTAKKSHTEEVTEANNLTKESISKCRWAKAPG